MSDAELIARSAVDAAAALPVPKLKFALISIGIAVVPSLAFWCKKNLSGMNPWWLFRILWVLPYAANLITVSIPGRFDSLKVDQQGKSPKQLEQDVFKQVGSLFEPSGWAFAIWGVIYLSETILTAYTALIGAPQGVLTRVLPYWLAGNLFQSLWCFAFRPEFKAVLWLPASLLALGAVSFGGGLMALSDEIQTAVAAATDAQPGLLSVFASWETIRLLLLRFSFSLHTGWLAAATLLNFNAWVAFENISSMDVQIASAFFSAYGGAAIGTTLALLTGDPLIAFTVAWALAALADRTFKKREEKKPQTAVDTLGGLARTELGLSYALRAVGVGAAVMPTLKSMF